MSIGRRAKIAAVVAALAAVQVAVFFAYRAAKDPAVARRTFVAEAIPATHAPLLVVDRRGKMEPLVLPSAPTILHFWATWCKPCREELPELMALASDEKSGVTVIAVSVDETWKVIDHYFDGRTPSSVTRAAHGDVRATYGVDTLPASFLVDANGVMRFRLSGAQPWRSREALDWLASVRAVAR